MDLSTTCCIVGGGPAGMMLGFLLARGGVKVMVLEKHADFLRDFRGDTVHPSTLELMHELGLLDDFLARPHEKVRCMGMVVGGEYVQVADFSRLQTHSKFIAIMPQWHFLNFLAEKAQKYETFQLMMNCEAFDLIQENEQVKGVMVRDKSGNEFAINSELVVAADGRNSLLRARAGFEVVDLGAPMDVLWMRISRQDADPKESMGRVEAGAMLVMLNRGDYWQCGYLIAKGSLDLLKEEGIESFRKRIVSLAPFLQSRVDELESWEEIKLLSVKVDHLKKWSKNGLLCIGDSAHAMSPVGGVGVNLAVQDAVAAANHIYKALFEGSCDEQVLAGVQRRRQYPTRMTQRLQLAIQAEVIGKTLHSKEKIKVPLAARLLNALPPLQVYPAKLIGLGFRPEHIGTPEAFPKRS